MVNKYVLAATLAGGLIIGEYVQPYTSLKESIKFYDVPIAENFPKDPWNYKVRRELVEVEGKTYQGLYLVNEENDVHRKINDEGCTCDLKTSIDDFVQDAKDWVGEKVTAGKDWVKKTYESSSKE